MKLVVLPFILCGFISCQYSSPKPTIVKIETEYEGGCAGIDSCTKMVNTLFSDSSTETTFYVKYPSYKVVTLRDRTGKFISEIKSAGDKVAKYTMDYDEFGNEKKYVKESLSQIMPKLIETYENTYNQENKIIAQVHYNHHGNLKSTKTFQYDTMGYTMVVLKKDENGDTMSIYHFNGKKLVLEKKVKRPGTSKYKYDEKGRLLFEDVKFMPQIRRFYYYTDDLLVKTTENFRVREGKTFTFGDAIRNERISEVTEFEYSFDANGRPVKTRKLTFRKDKLIRETVVITEYY